MATEQLEVEKLTIRFTTHVYPKEQRYAAWCFALQRLALWKNPDTPDASGDLYGELISFKSPLGLEFTRINATQGQTIIDFTEHGDVIWLLLLLEGRLSVTTAGGVTSQMRENDILYGSNNSVVKLDFPKDHRILMVKIPRVALNLQQRAAIPELAGLLAGDAGVGQIFSGMLRAVADGAGELNEPALRSVESILPELIITGVLENAPVRALGGAVGMRATQLLRIQQTIEMRLGNPALSLQNIADEHGISPRYLQKLFEENGQSFSNFLRLRRLERCRLDLASPLHTQKSITEILFQWGFNDSASFSRAFRDEYGMSPREYRRAPSARAPQAGNLQRGRPESARDTAKRARPAGEELDADLREPLVATEDEAGQDSLAAERRVRHHFLPVTPETVHWGYFSRHLKPALDVRSGDYVSIEALTHHAYDDYARMIQGDPGPEDIYRWTAEQKTIGRRGAGPMDASAYGRGAGEGFGVHICTGPIAIAGAMPGDIVEIRILELAPRPSRNPDFAGRMFGSNAAAYWGFHYDDLLTEPKPREVITIYEIECKNGRNCAHAVYNYRWTPQTDPAGVLHSRIDYPGIPVDPISIEKNFDVLRNVEIPLRPHFGVIGMAPAHSDLVDSVPPSNFGGNLDNWRLGPGASVYLPVAVPGGLLSFGDPHASQGDSELCGTAIECSMNGLVQIILHPKNNLAGFITDLDYPLIETAEDWVILGFSHPDYLKSLGEKAQSEVYKKSSIDLAMRDAFRKVRRFLMTTKGFTEDEAISLISVGVDFGISQVVNGNWGVHAVISKRLFTS
jgi:acetamidase/formamidase/AraC-like DNA-binding protein